MCFSANNEKNNAFVWLLIAVAALVLAFLPFVFGVNVVKSFGWMMFSLMLGIVFLLGLLFFVALFWSSLRLDRMLSGEDLLAHWTYSSEEIAPYATGEEARLSRNKLVYLFFTLLTVVVCEGLAYILDPGTALVPAAILVIGCFAVIYGVPKALASYEKRFATDAYIGRAGALFCNRFHLWKIFNASLNRVSFAEGKPAFLGINYSFLSTDGSGPTSVAVNLKIPVPKGKEAEARRVVLELSGKRPAGPDSKKALWEKEEKQRKLQGLKK
jgi:hypothetical protein